MKNFVEWLRENDLEDQWSDNYREFGYCGEGDKFIGKDGKVVEVKEVEQFGGEGMGDQYFLVYSVKDGDTETFYKLDGWYASYDGCNFNDVFGFYEVEKKPVTVYKWLEVN